MNMRECSKIKVQVEDGIFLIRPSYIIIIICDCGEIVWHLSFNYIEINHVALSVVISS